MYRFIYILLILAIIVQADENDDKYVLGEGYKLGSLPMYIGGYLSTDYQHNTDTKEDVFRVNDIAFLSYGSHSNFSYMAEIEFKELYVKAWGDHSKEELNSRLYIERFYVDYTLDEEYIFRLGKYNSPVGYWNLTPINVLRETTSSPSTNYIIYPKYTSGLDLMYSYYNGYELNVDLLLQNNEDLDAAYNNFITDKHFGFGIEFTDNDFSLKLNGGYFHLKEKILEYEDVYYALLSFKYDTERFKIMGELGTQFCETKSTVPYSGYLQGVYRITEKHLPVIRFESHNSDITNKLSPNIEKDDVLIMGYTYRPMYPVALKAEYQVHSVRRENKAVFSFSVLF
ncbi:hypothetical protein KJ877_07985 [bacterium]|nr:hypothetical protein [bacterium]